MARFLTARSARTGGLVYASLLAIGMGLYANALVNPFLIDDLDAIVAHPDVISSRGALTLWGHDYWAGRSPEDRNLYRPVTVLSYWLNARLTGLNPWGFRVVNIALLAALGWLVFLWAGDRRPVAAAASALLVVCHPALASVVNNIVGRADVLAMIGVLAFAVLHRRALRDGWSPRTIAAAVFVCLIALGSKESGLIVAPVALVQQWLVRRPGRTVWLILAATFVPYLIARAAVVGVTPHYGAPDMDLTGNPLRTLGLFERLPAALSLNWLYLRELVWPSLRCSFIPDELPGWSSLAPWAGLLVLAAMIGAVAIGRPRRVRLAAAVALGNVLLIGNLLLPIGVYAAYRLMVPFVAAAAMAAALRIPRRWLVVLPIVAVGYGVLVVRHNLDWRSYAALTSANVARQPDNSRAHFLHGIALAELDRHQDALPYVERAVAAHPDSRQVRHELAKIFIRLGRLHDAAEEYDQLIRRHPDDLAGLTQRAALALHLGDLRMASACLRRAESIAPRDAAVMHNLAILAVARGNVTDALARYESLLREHPRHVAGRDEYQRLRDELNRPGD